MLVIRVLSKARRGVKRIRVKDRITRRSRGRDRLREGLQIIG